MRERYERDCPPSPNNHCIVAVQSDQSVVRVPSLGPSLGPDNRTRYRGFSYIRPEPLYAAGSPGSSSTAVSMSESKTSFIPKSRVEHGTIPSV